MRVVGAPEGTAARGRTVSRLALAAGSLLVSSAFAQSPPLTADYSLTVNEQHSDNHAFGGQSTFITTVTPSVVFRRDTEISKMGLQASVSSVNYSNSRAARDAVSYRIGFDGLFTRDRNTLRIDSDLLRDSRFSSTPGSPEFQLVEAQRTQFTFDPTFIRSLTERLSVNVGAGYTSSKFDQNLNGALFDFTNQRISTGAQYRVTELDAIGGTVSAARYRTDPDTTSSDSTSFQASWERRWTELLDTSVALGRTQTTTRTNRSAVICSSPNIIDCLLQPSLFVVVPTATESNTSTPTWNVTGSYRFAERSLLQTRYGKDILPSAGGAVTTRTLFTLGANHQVSDRLSSSASYQRTESEFTGLLTVSRNASVFESIAVRLTYSLAQDWWLDASLTRSESSVQNTTRVAHVMFVSIRKDWRNNRLWP